MTKEKENYFDSSNLIVFIWNNRKVLIALPIIAAVIAVIFSAPNFITPLFKSSVVVFPSTTSSVAKALLPQQSGGRAEDILEFGDEQKAEQLLQILNSDEIRTAIIEKFDLMRHYKIKPEQKFAKTRLYKTYNNNISFRRTEFMSVEITVFDASPDTAALIANEITDLLDKAKRRIKNDRALRGLEIVKQEYNNLKVEVKILEDTLDFFRTKGIHDYEAQSAVLSEQLATAMIKSPNSLASRQIQAQLDTLAKYGGQFVKARDELKLQKEELYRLKIKYDQAKVDVEQDMPSTFRVNMAYPAERKSKPVRSLIILLAAVGAGIFTLVVLLIMDTIKRSKPN
jgi:tyrosine-protein kinase Etk/Wzc